MPEGFREQGNKGWLAFYRTRVLAVPIQTPEGARNQDLLKKIPAKFQLLLSNNGSQKKNQKENWKISIDKCKFKKKKKYLKLWDGEKTILTGKFITINTYIKKEQRSQMNNLTLYFKKLEKAK